MEHLPQDMVPCFDLCVTEGFFCSSDCGRGVLEMAKRLEAGKRIFTNLLIHIVNNVLHGL